MREQRLLRGSVTRCRPSLSQFYILGSVPKKFCSLPSWALPANSSVQQVYSGSVQPRPAALSRTRRANTRPANAKHRPAAVVTGSSVQFVEQRCPRSRILRTLQAGPDVFVPASRSRSRVAAKYGSQRGTAATRDSTSCTNIPGLRQGARALCIRIEHSRPSLAHGVDCFPN